MSTNSNRFLPPITTFDHDCVSEVTAAAARDSDPARVTSVDHIDGGEKEEKIWAVEKRNRWQRAFIIFQLPIADSPHATVEL